jgi:hypothetical protein
LRYDTLIFKMHLLMNFRPRRMWFKFSQRFFAVKLVSASQLWSTFAPTTKSSWVSSVGKSVVVQRKGLIVLILCMLNTLVNAYVRSTPLLNMADMRTQMCRCSRDKCFVNVPSRNLSLRSSSASLLVCVFLLISDPARSFSISSSTCKLLPSTLPPMHSRRSK